VTSYIVRRLLIGVFTLWMITFILMALILVAVAVYARALGTRQLTEAAV